MAPDLVILDEAQRIKNWKTRRARSVKRIASDYAFVLTGTPLENRLEELHSIVEFIDRYRLGPLFRFLANHQVLEEDSGKVVGYRNLKAIGETLAPILLRRKKEEVLLQLPERMDKTFFVPMTKEQLVHHEENREIVARIVQKWRRYKFLSEADQRRLTIALQNMRMSCDNTYLLDQKTCFGPKREELAVLLEEILEQPDAKVVVFSQWTRMHDLVARHLERQRIRFVYLHGGVPSPRRKDLIQAFHEDSDVRIFLSTEAGGVGLNLQCASVVINMDLPWNPAVLDQRIGRVHRIGQHRPVRVVNFVSEGTIEHGMLSLLAFKRSLFTGVLDGDKDSVFMGETRMNSFMKMVEETTQSIPDTAHDPPPPVIPPSEEMEIVEEMEAIEDERKSHETPMLEPASPLQPLLESAASFLRNLGTVVAASGGDEKSRGFGFVEKDEKTGRSYLKIPMPNENLLNEVTTALGSLLKLFPPGSGSKDSISR